MSEAAPEAFLGVDGGGTRTRGVVVDREGTELARSEGPASLADPRRPEAAAGPIAEVARAAARDAGVALPAAALWAGIAGTGRETTRASVEMAVEREGVARRVRVGSDVAAAFHDAFGDGPGILVSSGTGSQAYGRGESGLEGRVGGWGSLLGDEGSGYAIGLESLRRVLHDLDGRGPETELRLRILDHLQLETAEDLVHWAQGATKGRVAALVPVVAESSRAGDAVAREILVGAVEELEGHLLTVLTNLGPWTEPPTVALAGGLLQPEGPLRKTMEGVLRRHRLPLAAVEPDAARGAAMLARGMGDGAG